MLGAAGTAGCGATAIVGPGAGPDASVVAEDSSVSTTDTPVAPPIDVPVAPPIDRPTPRPDVPSTMPVDVPRPRVDVPTPATSCGPENDGRACANIGEGCASTGSGGECASRFNCVCGRDRRWRCTTSSPVDCDAGTVEPRDAGTVEPRDAGTVEPRDAGTVEPRDAGTPGTCTFAGRYSASVETVTLWFDFSPEGLWRAAMDEAGLASPIIAGTYSLMGDTLVLTGETREGGAGGSCDVSDRGVYGTRFSADCSSMRLELRSEDCEGRGETLQRMTFSRR